VLNIDTCACCAANQYAYQQVYEQPHHEAKLSHELMGGKVWLGNRTMKYTLMSFRLCKATITITSKGSELSSWTAVVVIVQDMLGRLLAILLAQEVRLLLQ